MSTYHPDTWVMLKFVHKGKPIHKILAGWGGSYLYGQSWKLNSGVTKVTEDDTHYHFEGSSGSIYSCHKKAYGFSGYTAQIYSSFQKEVEDNDDVTMEAFDADTDFMSIAYE
jgi:hypothetical protein